MSAGSPAETSRRRDSSFGGRVKKRIKVAVTGAAGQIGYALIFRVASGQMFGPETELELQRLELEPALGALAGVVMELEDCAFPLLKNVRLARTSTRRCAV